MRTIIAVLSLALSASAFAKVESAYTSVTPGSCVTIDSSEINPNAEVDYADLECAGLGGYQVKVSGGDLRYSISLVQNGVELPGVSLPSFHDVGSTHIEWRYQRIGAVGSRTVKYHALIYRLNYQDDTGSINKGSSMMVVLRLNGKKSCVVGTISKSADMNTQARKLADNMSAPCQHRQ